MNAFFLIWVIGVGAVITAQDEGTVGDFTKSAREHIINQLEQPFVVKSVMGTVSRKQGDREPLPNVLFEIQGPGGDRQIRRTLTDKHGRFKLGHVPEGTYKIKATLNGFQSVTGTITVSNTLRKRDVTRTEIAALVF